MESGFHRCGILILRKGNICNCEEITLLNGQVIRKIENDGYKYLGIAVLNRVKEQEDKEDKSRLLKFSKEFSSLNKTVKTRFRQLTHGYMDGWQY